MMQWVIRRVDQGGGWVSQPGSRSSYTHRLQDARRYASRSEALADLCHGNEVIERLEDAR